MAPFESTDHGFLPQDLATTSDVTFGSLQIAEKVLFQYSGSSPHALAEIDAKKDGTNGGDLEFYTKIDTGSMTKKLTIASTGAIGIGAVPDYGTLDAGHVLTSRGSDSAPTWTTPLAPASSLTASFRATSTSTTAYTFTGGKPLLSAQLENVTGNKGSFNIGGAYNPTTGLFTAPETGVYSFYGSVFWQTSAFNAGYITSYISTPSTSTDHPISYALLTSQYGANEAFDANFVQIVSGIVSLTTGDSIGLYVYANNPTLQANISRQYSYFCGHKV